MAFNSVNVRILQYGLVSVFCLLLILNQHKTSTHYVMNDSYHSNTTTQFNNTIYVISYAHIQNANILTLLQHKFGSPIRCKDNERQQFVHQFVHQFPPALCLKYFDIHNRFGDNVKLIMSSWNFKEKALDKMWSTKTVLHEILKTYCNKYHFNDDNCNFYLLSYHLGVPNERIEFLTKHIDCNNNQPQYDKTWVFKETAHGGTGVHLINNHQEIYRLIIANVSETINNCPFNPIKSEKYFSEQQQFVNWYKIDEGYVINRTECLIQTFVSNPLLVHAHVFHLRSYLFIASYSNPMIVLHWPRPILMINPHTYNNQQKILNKQVIVTNRHEMDAHDFVDDRYKWVWGRTQFQNYLDQKYGDDIYGNYTVNKLNNDIKHIAKNVFLATLYNNELKKQKIFEKKNEFHNDILCMDIILNDKFELKLMEVNSLCLEFCNKQMLVKKIIKGG
eukprot:6322_1